MLDPEWPEQRMVDFLVEAYLSFGRIHCPPAFWQRHQITALAAKKGEGRAAPLHAKLAEAARVMAGLGWGPLGDVVTAGMASNRGTADCCNVPGCGPTYRAPATENTALS
jgi:hypothetical protein